MSVNIFSLSEHVFLLFPSFPPNIILHSMHMSHSCVPRGIICSRWQIKRGRKCRFVYEWASCLARTLALLSSAHLCHAHHLFRVQCALTTSSPLSFTSAFISRDSPSCDSLIVCFCFILAIIGHGLRGDVLSCAAIWHKFNNTCTHTRTKVRCGRELSCPHNLAHEDEDGRFMVAAEL